MRRAVVVITFGMLASLWLARPAGAASSTPASPAEQQITCAKKCLGQIHDCLANARVTTKACKTTCINAHAADLQGCGRHQPNHGSPACKAAQQAVQTCVQPCRDQQTTGALACYQDVIGCFTACGIQPLPTPTPTP